MYYQVCPKVQLVPLLFIIFINDITNLFTDNIKIVFADYTKIHLQSNNQKTYYIENKLINNCISK